MSKTTSNRLLTISKADKEHRRQLLEIGNVVTD